MVQLKNPEKVKPESVRDIVIDPDRGIRLTFYEADNGLEILAAIFDKNRWRDPEEAENWLRENLDAIKLYFNANGGGGSP